MKELEHLKKSSGELSAVYCFSWNNLPLFYRFKPVFCLGNFLENKAFGPNPQTNNFLECKRN